MAKIARKKRVQYPTKATLNLVMREHSTDSPHIALPVFLALLVIIGVFTKFAVIDRLAEVGAARNSLAAGESALARATESNAGYADVAAEYSRFFFNGFSEEETEVVDRMEILDLLERRLITTGQVNTISVQGNTMMVSISGVTLQGMSDLMRELSAEENVSGVSIYTAGTQSRQTEGGKLASVTMTITLVQDGKGGDRQ